MRVSKHNLIGCLAAILLGGTLWLSITIPLVHAQTFATENSLSGSEATTTISTITQTAPYETEQLLGDKVLGDFVLGPGKIELEIAPGESKTVELLVSNRIGKTQRFDLEIEDMTGSSDGSQAVVLLGTDRGPYTLKDYISIPETSFELAHNLRARVPVTITVPPDAEPGGRYGSVLVKTVTAKAEESTTDSTTPTSAIVSRIGTLFFIKIPGAIEVAGTLREFTTNPPKRWYQSGPVTFQIAYENTGSVHLNPYGEVRITNLLGEEVGFVELEPWFAMPDSLRLREIEWNRNMLLFGRYTATLELNRGYDNVIDTAELTFWVVPWKLAALGFVILFAVLYILRLFFKTFEFKRRS